MLAVLAELCYMPTWRAEARQKMSQMASRILGTALKSVIAAHGSRWDFEALTAEITGRSVRSIVTADKQDYLTADKPDYR